MATLSFHDFTFHDEGEKIKVDFLKLYTFDIEKKELEKFQRVRDNTISFGCSEEKAQRTFSKALKRSMSNLTNKLTKNPTLYIHKNSGIPLIGSLSFGIVDRGSDMLEIKPLTSCNADCIFCSVDEGFSTKKKMDIVIEKDYLIEETKKVLEFKKIPIHIFINPQGDPTLYAELAELVEGLAKLPYIRDITLITNGMIISEEFALKLIRAGLTEFNFSLHAIDPEKAKQLMNVRGYNVNKILSLIQKIKDKVKVTIAPVYLQGINEKDVEEVIQWCTDNKVNVLVQNFLFNKRGRNPVKEMGFDKFFVKLKEWEKKYNVPLLMHGKIVQTRELPKPFRKGEKVKAEIFSKGRYPYESFAAAHGRVITVHGNPKGRKIDVKITRDKYNVFYGEL